MEFVENKGQWDSKVKFKSDMGGSAFYLQQTGYKVMLNSKEDLQKLAAKYSGHFHKNEGTSSASLKMALPASGQPVIVHSHAYEVNFVGSSLMQLQYLINHWILITIISWETIPVNGHRAAGFSRALLTRIFIQASMQDIILTKEILNMTLL
jgi:hypothetical protein